MDDSIPHPEGPAHPRGLAHRSGESRHRSARQALLFGLKRVPKRHLATVGALFVTAVLGVVALFVFTEFDWRSLMDWIADLHPVPLILAMAVLPLIGFPILPVYLVAGARFGPGGGGAVVAIATAAHLLGSYLIARTVLRRPLERLLARWHAHLPAIPPDEEAAIALIAALVPGLPYVVRNYLLAMTGIRLRVYFWICLPIYVARSYVSILLGDLGTEPNRQRLIILGGVELLKVVICAGVLWWLRQHHRRVHGGSRPPMETGA